MLVSVNGRTLNISSSEVLASSPVFQCCTQKNVEDEAIAKYKGPLRKIKGRSPKCNKVKENALRTQEIIITMTGEFMYLTLF